MLRNRIYCVNWGSVYNAETVVDGYNRYFELFSSIYNACLPIVEVTPCKNARKPWMIRRLVQFVKNKYKLFPAFIKNKSFTVLGQ